MDDLSLLDDMPDVAGLDRQPPKQTITTANRVIVIGYRVATYTLMGSIGLIILGFVITFAFQEGAAIFLALLGIAGLFVSFAFFVVMVIGLIMRAVSNTISYAKGEDKREY